MQSQTQEIKRLYRSTTDVVLGGVCAGLGEYFNIDPVIFRIIFVISFFAGAGILVYIILWVLIPPKEYTGTYNAEKVAEQGAKEIEQKAETFAQNFEKNRNTNLWIGIIIIIAGIYFLLSNFGFFNVFRFLRFDMLWPLILVIIGISLLIKRK